MTGQVLEGGCLCSAIRYRVTGAPLGVEYCHCGMCRRAGGAPVVCWADYPRERYTLLRGEPAQYASSEQGRRRFCPACGTSLSFSWEGKSYLSITLGSLDAPQQLVPAQHIYEADRLPWLHIADSLPRCPGAAPARTDGDG